ncbi:prepilin peptidase [Halarcobacter sp.]|uniref:prepilin peptidase n=1 Tax=Halarcobacter sp. TaxID=2321133 RepID=UPI002AAB8FD1|nr:prepilin peptidase [Halarcobacter sp.]
MIFHLSFFIFSLFISYIDCTRYKIPNVMLITLSTFLIIFGIIENELIIYSFIILLIFLLFFVSIILLMPKIILGGGDIKYILVITLYLQPISIPIFLIVTGIVQTFFLLYYQKIKKRRVAPMAPAIFLSVIMVKINEFIDIYNIM